MKSIVLISSCPLNLQDLGNGYGAIGKIDSQSGHRLVVEGVGGWFAINLDYDTSDDFDEDEREYIHQFIERPHFSLMEYSSDHAARLAISGLIYKGTVIVDNDNGLLLPIDEVKRRIERSEDWLNSGNHPQ